MDNVDFGNRSTYCGVISVEMIGLAVRIRRKGQWLTRASIDFVPVVKLLKIYLKGKVSVSALPHWPRDGMGERTAATISANSYRYSVLVTHRGPVSRPRV